MKVIDDGCFPCWKDSTLSDNYNYVPVPKLPDVLAVGIVVPVQQSDALTTTARGLGTSEEIERRVCRVRLGAGSNENIEHMRVMGMLL